MKRAILLAMMSAGFLLGSCSEDNYILNESDIVIMQPPGGLVAETGKPFKIQVNSVSDKHVQYEWYLDGEFISASKNFNASIDVAGAFDLLLVASKDGLKYEYPTAVRSEFKPVGAPSAKATAYITEVFDYMPAIGQFVNELPKYEAGNTQKDMNKKVLEAIGNNKKGMITLGGYGGYVTVGFDHTILNKEGLRDFRVLGNAFDSNAHPDPDAPQGGSSEPGIILVGVDVNGNGQPDENEWYEIQGSAHLDSRSEPWYDRAVKAGNDVNLYTDYEITYYRPASEPASPEEMSSYVKWTDNKGNENYLPKNGFHNQCYFPLWAKGNELKFKGTRLPQNGVDESGQGNYFVLYKFRYGYADNETNDKDDSAIDIDWAVNYKGQSVKLPGVDFVKVYTGVNQVNGWLGECSTEISGVEDLHILKQEIKTK